MNRSVPTGGAGAADQGVSIPSGPNAPPRKQIIGFAKFATRADAIVARDMLQSKRVDVEKGAVLKAEMAKKNLHTKRGVGSLGTASGPGGGPMPGNNPGGAGRSFSPHPEEVPTDATNSAWLVSNQSSSCSTTNPPSSSRGGSSSPPDPNCQSLEISQSQTTSRTTAEGPLELGDSGSLETRMAEFSIHSHRETSPQIPSPGSGGTGPSGRANAADQNPPINTLYVGNLPTTSATSTTNVLLEENLRLAFSRCPGYRKLCFRQKSNGPMCFVEFDDVSYATKALNDMYGHTLNGLIKNGIRLSYSKNPLGVR
ncbi:hypothetical protein BS47DRAFT_1286578, partial [Hydnum rufescens UP504]